MAQTESTVSSVQTRTKRPPDVISSGCIYPQLSPLSSITLLKCSCMAGGRMTCCWCQRTHRAHLLQVGVTRPEAASPQAPALRIRATQPQVAADGGGVEAAAAEPA